MSVELIGIGAVGVALSGEILTSFMSGYAVGVGVPVWGP